MLPSIVAAISAAKLASGIASQLAHHRQYADSLPLEHVAHLAGWLAGTLLRFALSDGLFVAVVVGFFYMLTVGSWGLNRGRK